MPTERFANNFATQLAVGCVAGDDLIQVRAPAAAALQASGQFRVLVDQEYMIVTAGASTTTWTVVRGDDGSTPADHGQGSWVTHVLSAGGLANLFSAAIGPTGATGPAGPPGLGAWKGTWSAVTTYTVGDGVFGSDNLGYISMLAGNLNHNPVGDSGTNWRPAATLSNANPLPDGTLAVPGTSAQASRADHVHQYQAGIIEGVGFPAVATGFPGQFYIDTNAGKMYPKTSSGWSGAYFNIGKPFNPGAVTGLIDWWHADSLLLADGATVTSWAGQNGTTFTPVGTGPTYKLNVQNGQPSVRSVHDGNTPMKLAAPLSFKHAILVASYNPSGDPGGRFDGLLTGTTTDIILVLQSTTQGFDLHDIGQTVEYRLNGTVHTDSGAGDALAPVTTPGVISISGATGWTDTPQILQDRNNGSTRSWPGDIFELFLFSSVLSATDRVDVENFLLGKYALV